MRGRRRTTKIGGSKNEGRRTKEETGKKERQTGKEWMQAAIEARANESKEENRARMERRKEKA